MITAEVNPLIRFKLGLSARISIDETGNGPGTCEGENLNLIIKPKQMKQTKDVKRLLRNSPIRRNRRNFIYALIVLLILIVGINLYISSKAQAYKVSALKQQALERKASTGISDKAQAYLEQIKQLTANYKAN